MGHSLIEIKKELLDDLFKYYAPILKPLLNALGFEITIGIPKECYKPLSIKTPAKVTGAEQVLLRSLDGEIESTCYPVKDNIDNRYILFTTPDLEIRFDKNSTFTIENRKNHATIEIKEMEVASDIEKKNHILTIKRNTIDGICSIEINERKIDSEPTIHVSNEYEDSSETTYRGLKLKIGGEKGKVCYEEHSVRECYFVKLNNNELTTKFKGSDKAKPNTYQMNSNLCKEQRDQIVASTRFQSLLKYTRIELEDAFSGINNYLGNYRLFRYIATPREKTVHDGLANQIDSFNCSICDLYTDQKEKGKPYQKFKQT